MKIKTTNFDQERVQNMTLDEFRVSYGNAIRKDALDLVDTYKKLKGGSKIEKPKKKLKEKTENTEE